MRKNKLTIIVFSLFFILTFGQAGAFNDVKTGSVTIGENIGGGGTNLNDLISWLDNPDIKTYQFTSDVSRNLVIARGELQQKLLLRLLNLTGGSNEYPVLVGFLNEKVSSTNYWVDWAWYYGGATWAFSPNYCPRGGQTMNTKWYFTSNFSLNMTVCKYGLLSALEEKVSAAEVQKLRSWLDQNQPSLGAYLDSGWEQQNTFEVYNTSCSSGCSQSDNYVYAFGYLTDKMGNGSWSLMSDSNFDTNTKTYTADKCENIKLKFDPMGEWFSNLGSQCTAGRAYEFWNDSPPTPMLVCSDKNDCLSKSQEYTMSDGTLAKGVQQVPSDFVANTEKSLSSSDQNNLSCSGGVCTTSFSGNFVLSSSAPQTTYYGQCNGYGMTIMPEGAAIPAVSSSVNVNVVNRAPIPTVTFAKNPIYANEEVNVTCDIVDPDDCIDEIVKVKWICKDSNGNSTNCDIWQAGTGQWQTGESILDIASSQQASTFQATSKFRASIAGDYSVTCEATDNDANNPLTGSGSSNISVIEKCDADGICNPRCPYDPDCCVDPYCLPYCPGYGNPHCVIPAGSCVVVRTKPPLEIDAVKPLDEVGYQASVQGGGNPLGYVWYCDNKAGASDTHNSTARTDGQVCKYENEGTYEPKALYQYDDGHGNVRSQECVNSQGVGIEVSKGAKPVTSCSISVNNSEVRKGESVTAKLSPIPEDVRLKGITVTWTANGVTKTLKGGEDFTSEFKNVGLGQVEAIVRNFDGSKVQCASASINVSELVRWGN